MTGDSPLVSVIMPVFNGARTVRIAIEAVLAQTIEDVELIVCDDASTDDTVAVVKRISDHRLILLENGANLGPGLSRNRAMSVAQGSWLAFIDADDSWNPERLEMLLRWGDAAEDVVLFDDVVECHDTAQGMVPWRQLRGRKAFPNDGEHPVEVPLEAFVRQRRWLIKPLIPRRFVGKHAIAQTGRPVHEDNEFFLECVARGAALRFVPMAMYHYRITPGSATSNLARSGELTDTILTMQARFADLPDLREAFEKKLAEIDREVDYRAFPLALKAHRWGAAVRMAWERPWLVREMMRRTLKDLPYHLHRLMHGGRIRGVR